MGGWAGEKRLGLWRVEPDLPSCAPVVMTSWQWEWGEEGRQGRHETPWDTIRNLVMDTLYLKCLLDLKSGKGYGLGFMDKPRLGIPTGASGSGHRQGEESWRNQKCRSRAIGLTRLRSQ